MVEIGTEYRFSVYLRDNRVQRDLSHRDNLNLDDEDLLLFSTGSPKIVITRGNNLEKKYISFEKKGDVSVRDGFVSIRHLVYAVKDVTTQKEIDDRLSFPDPIY